MLRQAEMTRKFRSVFDRRQSEVLAEVVTNAYNDLVKTGDFNELKDIVKTLAMRMDGLAVAQQRTEQRVEELAAAQQRTEQRVEELAVAQQELAVAQQETQREMQTLAKRMGDLSSTVGGIGNTLGYALENEAYRMLPPLLAKKYGLEMTERFVRTYIGGTEVNIFGKAKRDGQDVLIVGETKSRLDERRKKKEKEGRKDVWEQLAEKVAAVKEAYPDMEIKPLIVTHHARPGALKQAEDQGIIVVQSFEW